jgi:dCTP deaminase
MTSAMTRLLRSCGPTSSANKCSTAGDKLCTNRTAVHRKCQKRETALIHRNNPPKIDALGPSRYAVCMAILSDRWIREQALEKGMIEPFVEAQRREGCISYGLSSYGYDARVSNHFKIFTNVDSATVDPKDFAANSFVDRTTDVCIIPPNSFALAHTVEYFRVPRDVMVICLGKSTYARCGIIVNVTPLEPGWEGHVTLEFSNTTPLPAKVYANEGACQFLFLQGNEPCEVSYADRAGKYMGQKGVTLPKL